MLVTIVCQLPCTAGYYLELLQNATLHVDILARLTSWQNLKKKTNGISHNGNDALVPIASPS